MLNKKKTLMYVLVLNFLIVIIVDLVSFAFLDLWVWLDLLNYDSVEISLSFS